MAVVIVKSFFEGSKLLDKTGIVRYHRSIWFSCFNAKRIAVNTAYPSIASETDEGVAYV